MMKPIYDPDSSHLDNVYKIKMHILRATNDLSETIAFDDLSVKEICSKANISRQSFYRYFVGKYEILLWFFTNVITEYQGEIGQTLTWEEAIRLMHRVADRRIALTRSLYSSSFRTRMIEDIILVTQETIRRALSAKSIQTTPDIDFQIDAWAYVFSCSIAKWNRTGQAMPAERFSQYLVSCVPTRLYELLEPQFL
jgi:AcrR family transcriptional regulator